jgi:cytochrome P450
LKKLQGIIHSVFPNGERDWPFEKVKGIPYLDAVINETLRLKPAIPGGVPRVTPTSGIQIDEVYIPGDVNVIVPAYAIHRDPRYFEDPNTFIPERWTDEKSDMILDRTAYAPFSLGKLGSA